MSENYFRNIPSSINLKATHVVMSRIELAKTKKKKGGEKEWHHAAKKP